MKIKLAIPKGKLQIEVIRMLEQIGICLEGNERNYRPKCSDPRIEVKLLKSQNIPSLVEIGQHDIGFAGLDWITESEANVEILKDLNFNPVNIVACIPEDWNYEELKKRPIIVASEYLKLSDQFLQKQGFDFKLIRSYGATEVFPPEDADMIIDNTSTGTTIKANRLKIVDTIYQSSTQFIANKDSLKDPLKQSVIQDLMLLMNGVMNGRQRVLLEMNCSEDKIDSIVELLPAMRSPTISQLYKSNDFSVKAAVSQNLVKSLIPQLIAIGATDILEVPIRKVL